ncbi:hypothetical protein [Poseidonibacter sp.]|uniref:hypothetical protein n=1 Tax=Poseidonibacter sp. TaxID=2321188 RepID=UPI003C728EC3
MDISILSPTFRILYQPIPMKYRTKVLAFRETIIEPLSLGIAGVLLLYLSTLQGIEPLYYIIILMALCWLYFAWHLKNEYVITLKKMFDTSI